MQNSRRRLFREKAWCAGRTLWMAFANPFSFFAES
jgi:hypothetical protein